MVDIYVRSNEMTMSTERTDELLDRAEAGSDSAVQQLLSRHRERLRQMVSVRLDRRLASRVDPSDVVQEAFVEAVTRMPDYLKSRALPFYPWLRQLALDRINRNRRTHLETAKRSVAKEECPSLSDESVVRLARRLVSRDISPSAQAMQHEIQALIRKSLASIGEKDRELLIMKYLEHLSLREIALVLGISEAAAKSRHIRALGRFSDQLGDVGKQR